MLIYTLGFQQLYVDSISPLFNGRDFQILNAINEILGTGTIPNPAFDAANDSAIATLTSSFNIPIIKAGEATKFRAFVGVDEYEEGTVGLSGADLNLPKVLFNIGDTAIIASWNLSFPA